MTGNCTCQLLSDTGQILAKSGRLRNSSLKTSLINYNGQAYIQKRDVSRPSPSHVSHHHLQLHVSVTRFTACSHCAVMTANECLRHSLAPANCLPIFTRSKASVRSLWTLGSIISLNLFRPRWVTAWWPQVGLYLPRSLQKRIILQW